MRVRVCALPVSGWLANPITTLAVVVLAIFMSEGPVFGAAVTPADTPQAWADQLVALYAQEPHTTEARRAWDEWYASLYDAEFTRLIADNHKLASRLESIGSLDHDPLCNCQSGSGRFHISSVGLRPDGLAEVKATHCYYPPGLPDECAKVDLILKRIDNAWKLYDVMERGRSVRDVLVHDNACYRSADAASCFRR